MTRGRPRRRGARLGFRIDRDDETGKEHLVVGLWPGRPGARRIHIDRIELPLSPETIEAFSVSCARDFCRFVHEAAEVTRILGHLDSHLEQIFERERRERTGVVAILGPLGLQSRVLPGPLGLGMLTRGVRGAT